MGYSVDYSIENATIPLDEWAGALAAINGLFADGRRYRWLAAGTRAHTSLEVAIEEWGFDVTLCGMVGSPPQPWVEIKHYHNEKAGEEEVMLKAIAPFINPDAVFECRGEDGDCWRYVFRYGELVRQQGRIVYE